MVDKREDILARLLVVVGAVTGVTTALRNQTPVSESKLPAVVVFDADELGVNEDPERRVPAALRRVVMSPQIFILVQDDTAAVGKTLNDLRASVVKAILTDAALIDITHDNVGIRYEGCLTGLALGRKIEGQMALNFSFTYILNAAEL